MSTFSSQCTKVFGLLLLLTTLSACRQDSTDVDEFYTEKGEWDSARIPFIQPYEAVIFGKNDGWGMALHSLEGGVQWLIISEKLGS